MNAASYALEDVPTFVTLPWLLKNILVITYLGHCNGRIQIDRINVKDTIEPVVIRVYK